MHRGHNRLPLIFKIGRYATGNGILGLVAGLVISLIYNFSTIGTVLFTIFMIYIFLTGFWGGYRFYRRFRKFRYRMPELLWILLNVPAALGGAFLGWIGWGVFEHFILLTAMATKGKKGMILSQIILIPRIGSRVAEIIGYKPEEDI